jgi:hypothetical protein
MLFRARPSTNRPKISLTSEHHFRFSTALGGDCYDQKIAPAGGGPAEAGLADLGVGALQRLLRAIKSYA